MNQDFHEAIDSLIDETYLLFYKSVVEAESQAKKCLGKSENHEYSDGIFNSRILLILVEVYKGNSDLVRDRLSTLEDSMSLNTPDDSLMRLNHVRGLYFMKDGVYRDAFDSYVKTGNFAGRLRNKFFQALSANGKGVIKLDQQEYEDAYDYFSEARRYLHGMEYTLLNSVLSLNMACAMNGQNNITEVPVLLNESLKFALDHDAPVLECSAIDELASFFMRTGQLREAREHLERGLKKGHDPRYEGCMSDLIYHYAELLVRDGEYDKAEQLLKQQGNNSDEEIKLGNYHKLNARIYEMKGDFKNAYFAQKASQEISHNIQGQKAVHSVFRQEKRELQEQNHRLRLISAIGQELVSNLDIGQILNLIYAQMNALMPVDYLSVAMVDDTGIDVKFTIYEGERIAPFFLKKDNPGSLISWTVRNNKEIYMRDVKNEYQKYIQDTSSFKNERDILMQSVICIPLLYINDIVGVLSVQCAKTNAYTGQDIDNLRALASYAGIAIRNALQTEKMNELNDVLRKQSTVDSLTGLVNRRELLRQAENIWKICRRNGFWISVMMIDLDHFKQINDTHGHIAGDAVLRKIGEILNDFFKRPLDCTSRFGGEELLLLAGNMKPQQAAVRIEKVREKFSRIDFKSSQGVFRANFSCGIYGDITKQEGEAQITRITGLVDRYLYQAKHAGRGCTFLSDDLNKPAEKFIFSQIK